LVACCAAQDQASVVWGIEDGRGGGSVNASGVPRRKAPQLGFAGWDGSDPNGANGSAAIASGVKAAECIQP
jgi:hypothetical protein